jgi:general secretion pathway protein D
MSLLAGSHGLLDGPSTAQGEDSPARLRPRSLWQSSLIAPGSDSPASRPEVISRGTGQFVGQGEVAVAAKTVKGADGVTINLLNAPVAQAAKTILGDVLKVNYVVSDKVAGTVTVQTTSPVEPAALVDIFEAVLKANGVALVRAEGHYRIVPLTAAGSSPVSLNGQAHGHGISTRIVPLRYIAAAEMRRVIEPMVEKGAILRVDDQRNLLVINGTGRELANFENLVSIFDVDWMRGMSFALFPVRTTEPDVIAKELETVFGLDKDGPLKGVVRIVPNGRLNSVLVMSSRPEHLDTARTWLTRFEKLTEEKEEQIYTYRVQNRPAAELAGILQKVLATKDETASSGPAGVAPRFEPATVVSPPSPARDGRVSVSTTGAALETGRTGGRSRPVLSSQVQGGPRSGPDSGASTYWAGDAKIVVDEQRHALVIQTVPSEYQRIRRILRHLDMPATQVMLEAAIAEVTLTDELKFGLKWFFEKRHNSFTFTDAASGLVDSTFPGFSYFLSRNNVSVVLDAVAGITKVNVVSAPTLTVMDNRTAVLQVGDEVPIITQTTQSLVNTGAPIVSTVQMRDTGVILSVTPRVNENGRVLLDSEQEVSNVAKTTSSGIDSPTIQQRRVRTTVTVSDGEAVALGGLIQERNLVGKTQVPILGDIPLVGNAFRTKSDEINRTELLIIIRPRVIRDSEEAARATEEYRSRIKLEPPRSQTAGS